MYLVLAVASLSAACVIPPSLEVGGQDAAPNSPPSIIAARTAIEELPTFGKVNLEVGVAAGTLSLELMDTDLNDTLHAYLFVDYDLPEATPPRSECTDAVPSGSVTRTATCDLNGVCLAADVGRTTPEKPQLSIVVFDRVLIEMGTPRYQNVTPPGLSTFRTYILNCTQGN